MEAIDSMEICVQEKMRRLNDITSFIIPAL
jgi:hypothetical protein